METKSLQILELSKHSLNDLSKRLVKMKLFEIFKGEDLQIQEEEGRSKGVLRVGIGAREFRLHIKSKRIRVWPNVKGIKDERQYIVFIDYNDKPSSEDADFYILDSRDWNTVLEKRLSEVRVRWPNEKIEIDSDTNTAVFVNQITKSGRPYMGVDVGVSHVLSYKDSWGKLKQ